MRNLLFAALFNLSTITAADSADAVKHLARPSNGPIKVAFVLSENATVIDFAGPWEVFQDVMVQGQMPFELYTVAPSKKPLHTSGGKGITITPDYDFDDAPEPDLVVIGAQKGSPEFSGWLRKVHGDNKIIMSVCTGAFKVAAAGLLSGKQATTHHDYADKLATQYPDVKVVRSVRYVQSDPTIYTAGGLTSGVDLALHIVDEYFGRETAQKTADYMEYQSSGWKKESIGTN